MTTNEIAHFLKWLDENPDVALESAVDFEVLAESYLKVVDPFAWVQSKFEDKKVRLRRGRYTLDGHSFALPCMAEGRIDFGAGVLGSTGYGTAMPRIEVVVRTFMSSTPSYRAHLHDLEIVE